MRYKGGGVGHTIVTTVQEEEADPSDAHLYEEEHEDEETRTEMPAEIVAQPVLEDEGAAASESENENESGSESESESESEVSDTAEAGDADDLGAEDGEEAVIDPEGLYGYAPL